MTLLPVPDPAQTKTSSPRRNVMPSSSKLFQTVGSGSPALPRARLDWIGEYTRYTSPKPFSKSLVTCLFKTFLLGMFSVSGLRKLTCGSHGTKHALARLRIGIKPFRFNVLVKPVILLCEHFFIEMRDISLNVSRILDILLTRHQIATADYRDARVLFLQRYHIRTGLVLVSRFITRLEVVHRQFGQNVSLTRHPVDETSDQDAIQLKGELQLYARITVGVDPVNLVLLLGQKPQD